jgi:hypothetical protein
VYCGDGNTGSGSFGKIQSIGAALYHRPNLNRFGVT